MKTKILAILSIILCLFVFQPVDADEEYDISKWAFIKLTNKSDQDRNVAISKYYNVDDSNKYAFCIEPRQKFLPVSGKYNITVCENEYIYNIVKAYDEIGTNDDNYFIAAQILIWEDVEGISYTFDGNDFYDYKQELLNIAYPNNPIFLLKSSINDDKNIDLIQSYVGEEICINKNYSDYDIETDGVSIISNNENGLICIIESDEPEIKTLEFTPKSSDENRSYVLKSENSQDLYFHDGEYNNLTSFSINLKTLMRPKTFDVYYSKKDEFGNNIKGAEFSIYEIDDNYDDELVFIKNDIDINIFEAILGDNEYQNLFIETSERFDRYINGNIIHTKEIGYFPYKIYAENSLIKEGIVYVLNNDSIIDGSYTRIASKRIFNGFSDNLDINIISGLSKEKDYYLCESEPKKGYIYASEPCVLVESNKYDGKTFNFINSTRTYTLRLMKQSPEKILLNGAKFKISYDNSGENEEKTLSTGAFIVERENNSRYLIYKHENDANAQLIEFTDDIFEIEGAKPGKYYYYQSDSEIVNNSLLYDNSINVINGGFSIENLPYSSSLTIEELVAPKGYIITEPIYYISPDINYSEITFKNYRVNTIDIIPKKFKIPKTCING